MLFRRGEGREHSARGSRMVFKATADTTGGAFSVMERQLPPGGTPPPAHTHEGYELFYVLEGEVEFHVGTSVDTGSAGDSVLVPSGARHTFVNISDAPARVLILHAPAADAYFADLEGLWSADEPPSAGAQAEVMRRHGIEPV